MEEHNLEYARLQALAIFGQNLNVAKTTNEFLTTKCKKYSVKFPNEFTMVVTPLFINHPIKAQITEFNLIVEDDCMYWKGNKYINGLLTLKKLKLFKKADTFYNIVKKHTTLSIFKASIGKYAQ